MQLTEEQIEEIKEHVETLWALGPTEKFYEAAADGRSAGCQHCGEGGEWFMPPGDDQMAFFYAMNQLFKVFIPEKAHHIQGI